jgi:hypothetical protein
MRGKVTLVAGFFAVVFALPAGSHAQDAGGAPPPAPPPPAAPPPAAPAAAAPKEGEVKTAAPAEERTVALRSFDRFEFDAATQKGFWAEAGFLFERTNFSRSESDDIDANLKTYRPFLRFAYGGEKWEANLLAPFVSVDGTVATDRTDATIKDDVSQGGIGDIQLAGRWIPLRTALLDAGAGVNLSLPTGDEDDTISAGEFGALPFATAAIHLGVADVQGHIGYRFFFSGSNNNLGTAADQLVWGFGIFLPLFDRAVLRNEFSAFRRDVSDNPTIANYIGGLDFRIPIGDHLDLLLRPTGSIGLTKRSPDFGVGFSIAVTAPNYRPGKATSEYGDVVIE